MKKNNLKIMRKALDKKLMPLRRASTLPTQGWIKTIREALCMTTTQLAKRLGVKQPRITILEKNEKNLKLSTLERVAEAMDCKLIYAIVPKYTLEKELKIQATKKAEQILSSVQQQMAMEDQLSSSKTVRNNLIQDLLNDNTNKIWD
jgi:predicted DNA-binding mobile mystery protein A